MSTPIIAYYVERQQRADRKPGFNVFAIAPTLRQPKHLANVPTEDEARTFALARATNAMQHSTNAGVPATVTVEPLPIPWRFRSGIGINPGWMAYVVRTSEEPAPAPGVPAPAGSFSPA
jgi:hypothetical protein